MGHGTVSVGFYFIDHSKVWYVHPKNILLLAMPENADGNQTVHFLVKSGMLTQPPRRRAPHDGDARLSKDCTYELTN